ncbi:MAG TPA: hypothetical protein VM938_07310 [Acidimicrobiales bacterium]|nr:hypothetical protein [Acidimicrobiales bacterium]
MTQLLYLRDAYLSSFSATVVETRDDAVALDRTAFYATGSGQPNDTGVLAVNEAVTGELDFVRRHALVRAHTALPVCGVIWHEWGKAVTGGNMEPLAARIDFEFDPLPEGFGAAVDTESKGKGNKRTRIEVVDA